MKKNSPRRQSVGSGCRFIYQASGSLKFPGPALYIGGDMIRGMAMRKAVSFPETALCGKLYRAERPVFSFRRKIGGFYAFFRAGIPRFLRNRRQTSGVSES